LSVSECNPLNRRDADSKLRFKSLKESKGLISATCGREYTTLVEYAVREGEVTARIDKIAVPKRAVLKLAVINQNPVPLEGTNSSPSRSRIDVVSHRDLSVYPVDSGVVESTSGTSIVGFRIVDGAPQIIWGIVQRNELRVNT
jgi:hypothetical protein